MFSRDIRNFRHRAPRTLNDAFGPYSRLTVPVRHRRLKSAFWMLAYGIGCGVVWYVAFVIGVGR